MENGINIKKTNLFLLLAGIFITNALLAEILGVKIFSAENTLGIPPAQINLFGDKILTYLIETKYPLIDIDTIHDFKLGEYFLKNYKKLFKHLL